MNCLLIPQNLFLISKRMLSNLQKNFDHQKNIMNLFLTKAKKFRNVFILILHLIPSLTPSAQASEIPDPNSLTLDSFPPVLQGGQFIINDSSLIQQIGWNPSTVWQQGQRFPEFMKLVYFQNLGIGQLSLRDIFQNSLESLNISNLRLSDIGFLNNQTLGNLVIAIPNLRGYHLRDIPLIDDLVNTAVHFSDNMTIEQILNYDHSLQNLRLDRLNLNNYGLDALPRFIDTPIEAFPRWQETIVAEIPGLSQVPFAAFPQSLANLRALNIGHADIVLNEHQNQRFQSLVGSYQDGFNVPCQENCPHIEFNDPPWLNGGQWISGQTLKVRGGHGFLGSVNGGKEPAGRHPFGNGFKVVLWNIDEAAARADMVIFFNLCIKETFIDLGCTPYIFGPVPWFPIYENSWTPI